MSGNELRAFNNKAFGRVRTIYEGGEVFFVGKDVATALGYSDTDQAIRQHVDNEDIMSFMVNLMCVLSAMRRQEGRNDLLTDFFLSQGKEPPAMVYEVDDGMGGKLLSDDHGNIMGRPHHHIPRYLRAVK